MEFKEFYGKVIRVAAKYNIKISPPPDLDAPDWGSLDVVLHELAHFVTVRRSKNSQIQAALDEVIKRLSPKTKLDDEIAKLIDNYNLYQADLNEQMTNAVQYLLDVQMGRQPLMNEFGLAASSSKRYPSSRGFKAFSRWFDQNTKAFIKGRTAKQLAKQVMQIIETESI